MRTNPYSSVVVEFENEMAKYCNSKFAVAVDTCTDAIFLCLQLHKSKRILDSPTITIPARTYCSVANAILHCGYKIDFHHEAWDLYYRLRPLGIIDSALRVHKNIYSDLRDSFDDYNSFCTPDVQVCLSFQFRKNIPIGRGGMILLDNEKDAEWLRLARFNGRPAKPLDDKDSEPKFAGWLCHMEPERAARGLSLLMTLPDYPPILTVEYPDLSKMDLYKKFTV